MSTSSSYPDNTGGADFQLRLDVTDADGEVDTAYKNVTVNSCPGTEIIC